MSVRPQSALLALTFISLSLAFALILQPHAAASEPEWVEVRSPNFSVITDAGEHRGRDAALRFEQMRAVFGSLMTKAKVSLPVPLQIVAFRNTKEMRQVAPIFRGKPTQVAGLFQGGADRSFIMLDMSAEDPWTVVFHEYAHQLMNGNMDEQTDPWFEEGFAEYFSSIEVDGKEARVGKVPQDNYLIMQQVGTMHISDLFKVRQYSETYNASGNNRTTFYVESGMLLHYIYDNQLLPKVATYFELKTNKHVSVEDSIQQAFGMNAAQLDNALRRYIAEGRYRYYRIPAPASISKENYTSRPLTVMDANTVIADIHLHSPDYHEKAIAEFQEVLKSDSNNSAACRGLGYAYLQKQDFSQAAEYFRRASQLDSKDPRVHYYRALLLAREGGFTKRADIPELTLELETSISIDPTFADSYALLAFAQNVSGDPAKALVSIRKALTIDPRNENYRFNLANALVANRQPDQALKVLQSLRNSTNPEIASRAAIVIGSLEEFQNVHSGTLERQSVQTDETPESELPSESSTPHQVEPTVQPKKWGPAAFVRGVLKSVDCSTEPAAVLIISTGSKTLQLQINDMAHVILIGADEFSCDWSGKKVAVNYHQADTGETSIISLELQEGSTR